MSAILCGKRSFFEDSPTTPVSSKRIRCSSSTSPNRLSPPRPTQVSSSSSPSFSCSSSPTDRINSSPAVSAPLLDHLRAIFPDMDEKLLERALEECSNDLDRAIKCLNELRLGSAEKVLGSGMENSNASMKGNDLLQSQDFTAIPTSDVSLEDPLAQNNIQMDGSDWVELFVREMTSASNMDDARARASRLLEVLEKSILAGAASETAQNFHKENMMLKEQVEILIRDNTILKRAVAIQHERQKEFDDKNHELQHLKQLVSQYQERLKTLEMNNYALTMHLRQAQQNSSIPGRFHPDVF